MAVYDATMFFQENDLYEIRLNTHWDFVDKFIVVEAGETHTGIKKPFRFDHERFKKYSSKIHYVKFDSFDEEMQKHPELLDAATVAERGPMFATKDWTRDRFQYNYIFKALLDDGAKDDDIVYISCLDELLKKEAFEKCLPAFKNRLIAYPHGLRPIFFMMLDLYAYKFNLLHKPWTQHIASTLTEVGNFRRILPATLREQRVMTHPLVENAGWEFTFLDKTDGEMVLAKQQAWAHSRDQYPGRKVKFDHTDKQEAVQRLFEDYQPRLVPITTETHPPYIVNNLDKLQNFIYTE